MTRILRAVCLASLLVLAIRPAAAGINPQPFLDFDFIPDAGVVARFDAAFPAVPPNPTVPVQRLTLSLVSPASGVVLDGSVASVPGGPANSAGIVDFRLTNGGGGDIAFVLRVDVALPDGTDALSGIEPVPFLIDPVSGVNPDPFLPGPLSMFGAMFDTMVPGGIVHYALGFEAMGGSMFSDISIAEGSILIGFDLSDAGTELFRVTITGSAEPVPEPATLALLGLGLAGLGLMRRRRAATKRTMIV